MRLLLTFTYRTSLKIWYNSGIFQREILLYEKLKKKNIETSFLTYGNKYDLKYSNLIRDIKIYPCDEYVKSRIPHLTVFKILFLPIKLRSLFKVIDVVKTNQLEGSWIIWIAKLMLKKKIILRGGFERLSEHIIQYKYKKKESFSKYLIRYFWIFIVDFISYRLADGIILTSDQDISFIVKRYKLKKKFERNRIRHFYNFVDTNSFKPENIIKKDKHILFIGRMTEQKNLFNLFYALKDLNDFTLDIIGEGNFENKLREKAKELKINVNFLGIFPNNKIPMIMNQYQIFILPSYWEGNPKVLLEAMSCGLACIGSNIRGITNILKHKINGYICELNPESLKCAILDLYNNPQLREKISKNARKFILDNCSIESISNKEYEFYKEIINK